MSISFNTDITFYCAFNDFGARIGIGETVVSNRKELVENIRSGQLGFENVQKVLCFNAAEGWATDCTDDVLADVEAEVQRLIDAEDFPVTARAMQAAE